MSLRNRQRLAWLVVAAVTATSLLVRVEYRGQYYPGWDLVGAAHGLHLVSTLAPFDALVEVWTNNRHNGQPFPYYSVIGALLPGALTALVPWDHWSHVVTLVSFLLALVFVTKAAGLSLASAWIVPLAWSASPALLSLAVSGYPWATAFLPHALALWIVLDDRFGRRPLLSLAMGLLTIELAWHCYEPGRTVGAVFVAGALLAAHASRACRLVWLATGAAAVVLVFRYPTMNLGPYVRNPSWSPGALLAGLEIVAQKLFVEQYLDLPVLVAAGLLACLVPTRRRLLVAALFALQVLFVAGVAVAFPNASHVRPRRFVMVDGYALALVATLAHDGAGGGRLVRSVRAVVVALLVVGSAWQVVDLARFVRTTPDRGPGRAAFTLPYSQSQVDYMVSFENVDWAETLIARVEHGERLLLIYNFDSYDENITNPSAVLERLYLRLGHARFVESVLVFGSHPCRQGVCLPLRPPSEIDVVLDRLRQEAPDSLRTLTGYAVAPHTHDGPALTAERARLLDGIERRFVIEWDDPPGVKFRRFSLRLKPGESAF